MWDLGLYSLELTPKSLEGYYSCVQAIADITAGKTIQEDDLILIGELPDDKSSDGQFYSVMWKEILKLVGDPVLSLIELREEDKDAGVKFSRRFAAAEYKNNPKVPRGVCDWPSIFLPYSSADFAYNLPFICTYTCRTLRSYSTHSWME